MPARKDATTPHARLSEYRAKRRFNVTPEPSGGDTETATASEGARARAKAPRFVIQKHAASHLHYDFRLEHDGVLLSWSVPKGPSLAPATRRLAMRTEDHPMGYADFEGVIPEGEYGGGTVIVWDRGTWKPESDASAAIKKGRLTFNLEGEKLRGRWHLVKTRPQGTREAWLLFKGSDDEASDTRDIVAERPESVITGRTLDEVGAARDRVWHSNRAPGGKKRIGADIVARKEAEAARRSGSGAKAPVARTSAAKATTARRSNGEAAVGDLIPLVSALPVGFPLTNLDKVLYPEAGLTKAALIAYLAVVHEWMLAHVAKRPLTLVRCPEGHARHCFYQKHIKDGTPPAIHAVDIPEDDGSVAQYMMVDDLAGIVGLAQLGCLETHTWGCHADKIERPDLLVFDLDPDPDLAWSRVVDGALAMRARLRELGLESWVKTTGGKGLHVVAPVERRIEWDDFKAFAKGVCDQMAGEHPHLYTSNQLKARRKNKIYLDYLRNSRGATFIAPYSPRARAGAPVATPITWDELQSGIDPASFTIETVPRRLGAVTKDPWADIGDASQSITARARRQVGA